MLLASNLQRFDPDNGLRLQRSLYSTVQRLLCSCCCKANGCSYLHSNQRVLRPHVGSRPACQVQQPMRKIETY